MIIGIDGNEANVAVRVGIGEYSFELIKKFEEFQIPNIQFQIYLKNKPLSDLPKERNGWQYFIVKPSPLWTQIGLPFHLYTHKPRPDVFFTPTHYAPRFSPVPTVISVMDLSYIHFPQLFKATDLYQLRNWTKYSVKNAKKIFTISQASKNDIIEEYNTPEERVVVTYPGVRHIENLQPQLYAMKDLREKYNLPENYILFVGTIQPRKNIKRLMEAFSQIVSDNIRIEPNSKDSSDSKVQLVIVGKKGWLYDEIIATPQKLEIKSHITFLDFVSDDELGVLYEHALFFVLPSLYEGFGLPVLEAMKHRCPVITSKVSSLPEVGGDAALYVDPENTDDIVDKMKKLLTDKNLRLSLIEKGEKQYKKFSWEKTAKETLKILEEVGKGKI